MSIARSSSLGVASKKAGRNARPASIVQIRLLATCGSRVPAAWISRPVGLYRRRWPRIGVGVAEWFAYCCWRTVCLVALVLRGRGELHRRSSEQGRTENCQNCLSHRILPVERALRFAGRRLISQITISDADYYAAAHHETASKFVGQNVFGLNIQQTMAKRLDGLPLADPVQWVERRSSAKEADEEARICNPLDLVASVGANQTVTQGRDRSCR